MIDNSGQRPVRPRKIPVQTRSRATIDAVLSAAAHILEAEGLAAFNTNAVAERAGVSIGSLYQYFPNKDAILVALIERNAAAFADELAEIAGAAGGDSLADDLRPLLQQAVAWHVGAPRLTHVLDAEETRLASHLDLQPSMSRLHGIISRLLARHHPRLQGETVETAARQISLITRTLMEEESNREPPDWPMATERTLGAIIGYLAVSAPGDASRLTQSAAAD